MAEPFLHHVEGDAAGDGGDAEGVAQPLGGGGRPGEACGVHDGVYGAPAGHARPGPEPEIWTAPALMLGFSDAMHQIEGVQKGGGDRHGAIDPALTFFESFKHQNAPVQIHPVCGEGEGFGEAAAGPGQGHAQGAHGPGGLFCGGEKARAFGHGQIFAAPVAVEQLHAASGDSRGRPVVWFWGLAHWAVLSR